jgi:hypothetical protein
MNRDAMTLLRENDPARDVGEYSADRATLLLDLAITRTASRVRSQRRSRIAAAGIGAAVVATGGGGLAYAVFSQPASTTIELTCSVGVDRQQYDGGNFGVGVNMPSISGDPVSDCASEYVRLGEQVPQLAAYQTGGQYIAVMPSDWPAPAGWTRLPDDWRNDPVRLELRQRLEDLVQGPQSRCTTADEAERMVRADLTALGLSGWTVERLSQADWADGREWCAIAWVDGGPLPKVMVQGVQDAGWSDPSPLQALIQDLRVGVADACVPLPEAKRVVREAVVRNGFALQESKITASVDESAECSRVDFVPGGIVVVVLHGPRA